MKKGMNSKLVVLLVMITVIAIILIISFSKMVKDNGVKQIAKTTESNINNNGKRIITTSEIQFSWDKDPTELANLINKNSYIIKVRIDNVKESILLDENNGVQHNIPLTPIDATVIENIYGDINAQNICFYVPGGEVKISEIMKTMNDAQIEKMEYNKLTKEEMNNSYISYFSESDYTMEENEEYIIVVNKSIDNNYYLSCNGYGIFKENQSNVIMQNDSNTIILKNCLTGKEVNYTKNGEKY